MLALFYLYFPSLSPCFLSFASQIMSFYDFKFVQCFGNQIFHLQFYQFFKRILWGDFPGGPVVGTSPSNAGGWGAGLIPGRGAGIPHASGPKNQNVEQKQYCNKFNKDLKKNGPHQKKILKKKKKGFYGFFSS